jgi:hypothetical protein
MNYLKISLNNLNLNMNKHSSINKFSKKSIKIQVINFKLRLINRLKWKILESLMKKK